MYVCMYVCKGGGGGVSQKIFSARSKNKGGTGPPRPIPWIRHCTIISVLIKALDSFRSHNSKSQGMHNQANESTEIGKIDVTRFRV